METKKEIHTNQFGLVGKNISYSFSKEYFTNKFQKEGSLDSIYSNFDIKNINDIQAVLINNPLLKGLNVTIPYKESILPFINKLNKKAKDIGAINTIKISKKGILKGYNTDEYGFRKSIQPYLKKHHKRALILGTGGASKAIAYSLNKLDIKYKYVSRDKAAKLNYKNLTPELLKEHQIIINCTPLGTFPDINNSPDIPYQALGSKHLLYDLIYNPEETMFLKKGKKQGATIINGKKMLELQAEKAWEIWNK